MSWFWRLFESDGAKCERENENENWPQRLVGDGWRRRPNGTLVMGGCVRPVASAPTASRPPKPAR